MYMTLYSNRQMSHKDAGLAIKVLHVRTGAEKINEQTVDNGS